MPGTDYAYKPGMRSSYTAERGPGFTLVELMVVVGLIGLLAGLAVPSFLKARENSRRNKTLGDLRVIAGAVDQLAFFSGMWPGGVPAHQPGDREVWDLNSPTAGITASDGRFPNWDDPYIREVPIDPWGNRYFFDADYRVGSEWYSVVGSFGPNLGSRNGYDGDDIFVVLE